MNKAIILLSGGLDSIVSLGHCIKNTDYNVVLALTFDYGQLAFKKELENSQKICNYYNIEHKVIKLDWLKDITPTKLTSTNKNTDEKFGTNESAASVWVPNRNALFLNIAACYADSYGYDYIIFGANKEEAGLFPDNTNEFREKISDLFLVSTQKHPQVIAPLINYNKDDIVKIAMRDDIPLEYVYSCYSGGDKHCGSCESCYHLKSALIANNCNNYLKILFGENEN